MEAVVDALSVLHVALIVSFALSPSLPPSLPRSLAPSLPPSLPIPVPTAERTLPACPPSFLRHRQEPQAAQRRCLPYLGEQSFDTTPLTREGGREGGRARREGGRAE